MIIQNKIGLAPNEYPVLIFDGQSNIIGDTPDSAGAYAGVQSGVYIWSNSPATDPNVFEFKPYEAGVTSAPRYLPDGVTPYPLGYGWSVEAVIAKNVQSFFGKDTYVIKSGAGGQPISQWNPSGGALWTQLTTRIAAAKAAIEALGRVPVFIAYVWMQGEAEVVAGNDLNTYKTALSNHVNNVRGINSSMTNTLFVSYKLSVTYQTNVNPPGPSFTPTRLAFNTAMEEVINTKTSAYVLNPDSYSPMGTEDGTHYNGLGLISLGLGGYSVISLNLYNISNTVTRGNLKSWVRCRKDGTAISGIITLSKTKPKVGIWKQV